MPTMQRVAASRVQYQIGDLVVDLMQCYWAVFLLAQGGIFTMGGASVFAKLRGQQPNFGLGLGLLVCFLLAAGALYFRQYLIYIAARCVTASFFVYLAWLCLLVRPISTGVIYSIIGLGSLLLAAVATLRHLAETGSFDTAIGED